MKRPDRRAGALTVHPPEVDEAMLWHVREPEAEEDEVIECVWSPLEEIGSDVPDP